MPRSAGVRISAAIAIGGSVLTLLFAGMMVASALLAPPPNAETPVPYKFVLISMAAFCAALSAWGISTGICIFLRRPWARISMLVFAVLLAFVSGGAFLTMMVMPAPPAPAGAERMMPIMLRVIGVFYGLLAALGVWWLVLFNRQSAKDYFALQPAGSEHATPLSISVIAWFLLIGALLMTVPLLARFPAFLFGVVFQGGAAVFLYALYGTAQLYLGLTLLQLREAARRAAIAYFGLLAVNCVVSYARLTPEQIMRQMQQSMPQFFSATAPTATMPPMWLSGLMSAVLCAAPIYFLIRRRSAFTRP